MAETTQWSVHRMTGGSGTLSHGFMAVAPGCPAGRHPTRDCKCKPFKTVAAAVEYITEQITEKDS